MTPHHRLQLLLAAGNMAFWLGLATALAYRQAWIDEIARLMEQGR